MGQSHEMIIFAKVYTIYVVLVVHGCRFRSLPEGFIIRTNS
jgi:hypothetical protein